MTRLGALASLLVCGCAALVAQSNLATLGGSVEDQQSRPVTGATLQLTAVATGETRAATVNSDGLYEIAGLRPGAYPLQMRASGFVPVGRNVDLEVGQQRRLESPPKVGEKSQTLDGLRR